MGEIIKDEANYNPPPTESQWLKFEEGTTTIRLLSHSYHFVNHYLKGENKSYDCTGQAETCQWCQKNIPQRQRWSYVVLVRGDALAVKIVEIGWTIFETILNLSKDEDYGDPRKYDLKITRTGTGTDTSYTVIPGKETKFNEKELALLESKSLTDTEKATEYLLSFYKKDKEKMDQGVSLEEAKKIFKEGDDE